MGKYHYRFIIISLVSAFILSGCVIAPVGDPYVYGGDAYDYDYGVPAVGVYSAPGIYISPGLGYSRGYYGRGYGRGYYR